VPIYNLKVKSQGHRTSENLTKMHNILGNCEYGRNYIECRLYWVSKWQHRVFSSYYRKAVVKLWKSGQSKRGGRRSWESFPRPRDVWRPRRRV